MYSFENYRHKNTKNQNQNAKINDRNNDDMRFNNFNSNMANIMDLERNLTSYTITNQESDNNFDDGNYEQYDDFKGQPIRSQFSSKKINVNNNRNDFDLLNDNNSNSNIDNVNSFIDNDYGDYAGLDETTTMITKGSNPIDCIVNDASRISSWLFNNLQKSSDLIINGYGLFNIGAILYFISNNNMESNLKDFFGFDDKRTLNAGLLTIRDKIKNMRKQLSFDNYLIISDDNKFDTKMLRNMRKLIYGLIVNKNDIHNEKNRINQLVKSLSGIENTEYLISDNTLSKCECSFYNIVKVNPIWNIRVDSIVKDKFYSNNEKFEMEYIKFKKCEIKCFNDMEMNMIEIPIMKEKNSSNFSIGFCINKNSNIIDVEKMLFNIKYLKKDVFNEILIPKINKISKIRLNNTLYREGLNIIFDNPSFGSLLRNESIINDILQYSIINFNTKFSKSKKYETTFHTKNKFICNKSCIFYIRNEELNLIMTIGKI